MTKQKLAIFDLDGTLFRWQLYHELVYALKDKGCFPPEVADKLDEAFLGWTSRHTSFHDYEMQMLTLFLDQLRTVPTHVFDETAREIVKSSGHKVYRYTLELLKTLQKQGYFVMALSGSQQEVVGHFAELYGFDAWIGSLYERGEEYFTGNTLRHVPSSKAQLITAYADEHGFDLDGALAIGDSGSDVSLLELVGHPIAFNPAGDLLTAARERQWQIVVERKNIAYSMRVNDDGELVVTDTTAY